MYFIFMKAALQAHTEAHCQYFSFISKGIWREREKKKHESMFYYLFCIVRVFVVCVLCLRYRWRQWWCWWWIQEEHQAFNDGKTTVMAWEDWIDNQPYWPQHEQMSTIKKKNKRSVWRTNRNDGLFYLLCCSLLQDAMKSIVCVSLCVYL